MQMSTLTLTLVKNPPCRHLKVLNLLLCVDMFILSAHFLAARRSARQGIHAAVPGADGQNEESSDQHRKDLQPVELTNDM